MEIVHYKWGTDPLVTVWRTMDTSEHIAILEHEHDGKYNVVRGDGLATDCRNCPQGHLISPDDFIGEYDEAWEAVEALLNYLDQNYDSYHFQGKHPREFRDLKHPRGKKFLA